MADIERKSHRKISANKTEKSSQKSKKPDEPSETLRYCSFCEKSSNECHILIAGPAPLNANICEECLEVCNKILLEDVPSYWYHRLMLMLGQLKIDKKQSFVKELKRPQAKKLQDN